MVLHQTQQSLDLRGTEPMHSGFSAHWWTLVLPSDQGEVKRTSGSHSHSQKAELPAVSMLPPLVPPLVKSVLLFHFGAGFLIILKAETNMLLCWLPFHNTHMSEHPVTFIIPWQLTSSLVFTHFHFVTILPTRVVLHQCHNLMHKYFTDELYSLAWWCKENTSNAVLVGCIKSASQPLELQWLVIHTTQNSKSLHLWLPLCLQDSGPDISLMEDAKFHGT